MVNVKCSGPLGIIFTGGEGPPSPQILAIVKAANEDAQAEPGNKPLLAAADSGLLLTERTGLQPDWIVGDMDSLEPEHLAGFPPEKVLKFPHEKDQTDTELAFSLLKDNGCDKIWIIGGGGGRIDQLFGIRALFERKSPPLRWITAGEDIYCLEGGSSAIPAELAAQTGGIISVFPLGGGPWEAESSGLKWPLAGLPWNRGFFGISNAAPEDSFTIRAKKGRFMIILPLLA